MFSVKAARMHKFSKNLENNYSSKEIVLGIALKNKHSRQIFQNQLT